MPSRFFHAAARRARGGVLPFSNLFLCLFFLAGPGCPGAPMDMGGGGEGAAADAAPSDPPVPSVPSEAVALPGPAALPEAIKMSFDFRGEGIFQMALTADSVGVLPTDPGAGGLEPNDESDGIDGASARRALTLSERDSAAQLLRLTRAFRGDRIFACDRDDGYGFSVWSDSLSLHCRSCFSCAEGMGMSEAKRLARLGKLTLWAYRMRFGAAPFRSTGAARDE